VVSTLVRTIFEQPDPASVRAQHAQVVAALEAKLPAAAAHLDEARDDILAFTAFPARSGGRCGATIPRSASIKRYAGGPT
jgi:transposase-like protein